MKKRKISPEETKERLLEAGLHLFGVKGLEATRTRELAGRAGVNQAAIPYHFGGKEGLYLAVAREVVRRGRADMEGQASVVRRAIDSGSVTREVAGELLLQMLATFVDRVVAAEDISDRSRFIMREYSMPGAGFDIIYDGFLGKMHDLLCELVGMLVGENPKKDTVIIRAHSILGTVLSILIAKTLLLRRLGWEGFEQGKLDMIKDIVAEVVSGGLRFGQFRDMEAP